MLAGVSVDYYVRLERGNLNGASETVLAAIARALQLDEAERAHLFDLAYAGSPTRRARRRAGPQQVRPGIQRLLDAMTGAPAFVRNGRMDILAANALGRALYSEMFASPLRPPNTARFVFLDRRAPGFYADWETVANDAVAILRSEAGRAPYDRGLSDLVGELSTQSELFRTLWAAHNVRFHDTGVKRFRHPAVGELTLSFETMQIAADSGLTFFAYTAEPGSTSQDALKFLATWATSAGEAMSTSATL